MGFHKSSRDIQLKNRHILTAYCQRPSGEAKYSELDLDQILGAGNGKQCKAPPSSKQHAYMWQCFAECRV